MDTTVKSLAQHVAPTIKDNWYANKRLIGLTRFAIAITILNIAGHVFLGFEQSWVTPFIALATTYAVDLIGEGLDAWAQRRAPIYASSFRDLVIFLLPAHITGLAVSMLLYAGVQYWGVVFASALAIASKYMFRMEVARTAEGRPVYRHWFNPSNLGIAAVLLVFPTIGIAPPYQFAENTWGFVDWLLPLIIVGTGGYLNIRATGRWPLILAWVLAFATQGLIRALAHSALGREVPWNAGLEPITGFAFVLFTFYMITDPATTPGVPRAQIVFAVAVAAVYAMLMELHIVFGLFFALAIVTGARGMAMWLGLRKSKA